jgi:transposase
MPDTTSYAGWIGLDWSSKEHVFCIHNAATNHESIRHIPDKADDLLSFFAELRALFSNHPLLLGLEATRASIMPILLQQDFLRIILINPKTAANFRTMFRLSGVKSDALDATYLCRLIRTHPEEFRICQAHDPQTRQLAALTEKRRSLVEWRVQIANRLRASVACAFPQILELLHCQLRVPIAAHFLNRWPTVQKAQAAGAAKLRAFFYKNNVRTSKTLEARLSAFLQTNTLLRHTEDNFPFELEIQVLAKQLLQLHRSIDQFDEHIARCYAVHPVAKILAEVPGAGPQLKPRLAACLGTHRERFASAQELSSYTGIAPVHKSSGKKICVVARHIRPLFLHQTWIEFANCSIRQPGWARAFYETKRDGGLAHYEAVRAVAFKWTRVIFACWKADQPYEAATYLASLRIKNPAIAARIKALLPLVNN